MRNAKAWTSARMARARTRADRAWGRRRQGRRRRFRKKHSSREAARFAVRFFCWVTCRGELEHGDLLVNPCRRLLLAGQPLEAIIRDIPAADPPEEPGISLSIRGNDANESRGASKDHQPSTLETNGRRVSGAQFGACVLRTMSSIAPASVVCARYVIPSGVCIAAIARRSFVEGASR